MNRVAREVGLKGYTAMTPCELHRALTAYFGGRHPLDWPGAAGEAGRRAYRPRKDAYHPSYLTNRDLTRILSQYAATDPTFDLVGVVPVDFCDVSYGAVVCDLRLARLVEAGRTHAAVVFNTDPSDAPGRHWVLLWIDVSRGVGAAVVAYIDSLGKPPPPRIRGLMDRLGRQARRAAASAKPATEEVGAVTWWPWQTPTASSGGLVTPRVRGGGGEGCGSPSRPRILSVVPRDRRHQLGGSQCGVYVVYFVHVLLRDAGAHRPIVETLSMISRENGEPRVTHRDMRRFRRTVMSDGLEKIR
jgi:hypothetical protein